MAVSQSVGQFDNTAAISFALLSWILQDPELTQRIRTELEPVTKINEQGRKVIDVYRVGDECPLLLSAFHEVLRCIAVGVTVRHVEQDYTFEIKSQNI
jgi:cytochrome P450